MKKNIKATLKGAKKVVKGTAIGSVNLVKGGANLGADALVTGTKLTS
jgi:hypothetical protein